MGVNALNRSDKENISCVWYKHVNINSTTGVGTDGKHIKVRLEDKRNKSLSQPIKNLITNQSATIVSTRFNYNYERFDELYFLGARWQVLDQQIDYEANALANPQLKTITFLALTQLGGDKLWKTK